MEIVEIRVEKSANINDTSDYQMATSDDRLLAVLIDLSILIVPVLILSAAVVYVLVKEDPFDWFNDLSAASFIYILFSIPIGSSMVVRKIRWFFTQICRLPISLDIKATGYTAGVLEINESIWSRTE